MEWWWLLGYLAGLIVFGHAIVTFLHPRHSLGAAAKWGLSLLLGLGLGLGGFTLFYLDLLGMRPGRGALGAIVGAAAILIAIAAWRGHIALPRLDLNAWRRGWNTRRILALLIGGAALFLAIYACRIVWLDATRAPMETWDAWSFWMYKARVFAAEPLIPAPEAFVRPSMSYIHQRYPVLLSMLYAGAFRNTYTIDDHIARVVLFVLYVGFGLTLYGLLREKLGRSRALLLVALQLALPSVIRYAGSGIADIALAGFFGAAVCFIMRFANSGRWTDALTTGLLAASAAFTKNEGMPLGMLAAVAIASIAFARHRRQGFRAAAQAALGSAALCAVPLIVLMAPFYAWVRHFPALDENYTGQLSIAQFTRQLDRLPIILAAMGNEFVRWEHWGPLWMLPIAMALIGWRGFRSIATVALWGLLLAHLLLYTFIYVITPWNVNDLIAVTLERLLTHLAPTVIVLTGLHWSAAAPATVSPEQLDENEVFKELAK